MTARAREELEAALRKIQDPPVTTIELDCPPGDPRPGDLIVAVIKGTGLPEQEPILKFFGCWTWQYDVPRDEWVQRIRPVIRVRIEDLYRQGVIRYGSW